MRTIGSTAVDVVTGSIVDMAFDAIVNAANSSLMGGGGVDGAIHRAAGPALLEECRLLGGCRAGQAKVTRAYGLHADWIIHTVGPVWSGGKHGEADLLASCYRAVMACAKELPIRTIGIPAISTGVYRYPLREAGQVAASAIAQSLREDAVMLERVVLVCFSSEAHDAYFAAIEELA